MKHNLRESVIEWYRINAPLGKRLGYPKCCIDAFCKQSPEVLKLTGGTRADRLRYEAGCINGKFTGFIPCLFHAEQIHEGKLALSELITDRDKALPPFPLFW